MTTSSCGGALTEGGQGGLFGAADPQKHQDPLVWGGRGGCLLDF